MDNDFEIFEGKTYSSLVKDIYESSMSRRSQLDILVSDLREFIKGPGDVPTYVPFIKEYLEVANENDSNLVKLATTLGRLIASSTATEGDPNFLTDAERKQLMGDAQKDVEIIKFGDKSLNTEIDSINKKVTFTKDK